MKKTLLIIACLVGFANIANAQLENAGILTKRNTKNYNGIVTEANASRLNAMAYDSNNSLFTAGVFDTAFEGLEPIAASSYVMKNDESLNPLWKVALQGAATVTSMVSDAQGGVYVAGTLADEVVFNSTDANSVTKEGYKEGDAFTTQQCASFIAHYDKDGKLLKVGTIIPAHDPALDALGMYFPEAGDIYCRINKLSFDNGKLYASAVFTGKVANTSGAISVTSGSMDAFGGGFWFQALKAASVFEFNSDLDIAAIPFSLVSGSFSELQDSHEVLTFNIDVKGGICYTSFTAKGTQNIKCFDNASEKIVFTYPTTGETGFGYGIATIDLTAKTLKAKKTWETITTQEYLATEIKNVEEAGNNLIVTGIFQDKLGFNPSTVCVGSSDIFVASFNKESLELNWTKSSAFNEGDPTKNEEIMTVSKVIGNYGVVTGYTSLKADHSFLKSIALEYNVQTGEGSVKEMPTYNFGIASNAQANRAAMAYSASPITGISFVDYDVTSGVESITGDKLNVSVYPNPATDVINLSEEANVEIFSAQGSLVAKESGVKSINVSNLNNGLYILKANVNGTISTTKFVKK